MTITFQEDKFVGAFLKRCDLASDERAVYINLAVTQLAMEHYVKLYTELMRNHILQAIAKWREVDPRTHVFFLPTIVQASDLELLALAESGDAVIDGLPWTALRKLTSRVNAELSRQFFSVPGSDTYDTVPSRHNSGQALALVRVPEGA